MHEEEEFAPDPRKVTFRDGALFNPWVNIPVSLILTAGLGWMTVSFWGMLTDVIDAPAYEDQGLDIVGGIIGVTAGGLATIAMIIVTIWAIVWWAKRSRGA